MNFKLDINRVSALQVFQLLRFTSLLFIGIVFAKIGLSTFKIGQYETFLFLAGAVSFFWINGLIQSYLPTSCFGTTTEKPNSLFNLFYIITAVSIIAAIFIYVFEISLSTYLLKNSEIPFLYYLIAYIIISSPANLVEYIYLIRNQAKQIVIYGLISNILMFLLVIIPAIFGFDIQYSIIGLLAGSLFRLVWLIILLLKNYKPQFDIVFIKKHLKVSFPLVLAMLLSGSGQYIDGFIITSFYDEASFAIFRFGARELPLVLLLANAFSSSMLPGFSDVTKIRERLGTIRLNSEKMGNWLFPLSGLMMIISHFAFPILFNSEFSDSATIFNIYLLLIISRLLFPQTILIGLQKTRLIMMVSLSEIIVNVLFSLLLMKYYGLVGVAFGTVIAYLFEKLLLIIFVKNEFGFKLSDYLNVKRHIIYSVLLLLLFIIVEFFEYASKS